MDEVDLVRSVYARWARGEFADELFHPDIEWSMPHPGGQVRGREATKTFLREFMGTWQHHSMELESVRAFGGGRVLALFTEHGVGRSSGIPAEARPAAVWTVRDGLVTRFEAFGDRDEARALAERSS